MIKANYITLKLEKSQFDSVKITNSQQSADYIRQFYFDDIDMFESSFMLLLNRTNKITGYVKISQGGTAGTVIDPKIVAKYAIDSLCSGVVIAHNHPSGNIQPSEADKQLTIRINNGLSLFDIRLMDHIILTSDSFYSFADNGEL